MDISAYRAQFASFNSALELNRFQQFAGLTTDFDRAEIFDRYSDLFSTTAIAELATLFENTSEHLATQRDGLENLGNTARIRHVEFENRAITRELARCDALHAIDWRAQAIPLFRMKARIAIEADAHERDELAVRWEAAVRACDDLRIERESLLDQTAKEVGFDSYQKLLAIARQENHITEMSLLGLRAQTEAAFRTGIERARRNPLVHLTGSQLKLGDYLFIAALSWLNTTNVPNPSILQSTFTAGLGLRVDQNHSIGIRSAFASGCFPIKPPNDVRLLLSSTNDGASFLNSLQFLGEAYFYAWCSPVLIARNPEFVFSPDAATRRGYGFLFRYLAIDKRWADEFIPGDGRNKSHFTYQDAALELAIRVRSCTEDAFCFVASDDDSNVTDHQPNYRRTRDRAVACRAYGEPCWIDLEEDRQPLTELRALTFSFALREYLRTRHGYRWWSSRKAGEELGDLWSTSSRYSIEELASQLGFDSTSFDGLVEALNSSVN